MADPFSIIAGVAGIAAAATSLSLTLFGIASDIGSTREEIESFAMDVASFSAVMENAHESLRGHLSNPVGSKLLRKVTGRRGALSYIVKQSDGTMKRIKQIQPMLLSLGSDIKLMAKIKWVLRKDSVQDLKEEMGRILSKMNLLVMSVALNELLSQHQGDSKKM